MLEQRIKVWLKEAAEQVNLHGNAYDVHIDALFPDYEKKDKEAVFDCCCELISHAARIWGSMDFRHLNLSIEMQLEESAVFGGAPQSLSELISSIDLHYPPEIVVSRPVASPDIPLTEFYRSVLPFELAKLEPHLVPLYKAYKTTPGYQPDEEYIRTVAIYYQS